MKHNIQTLLATALILACAEAAHSDVPSPKSEPLEKVQAALTDPTRPNWFGTSKVKKQAKKSMQLNSLVNGAQRRLAVINGVLMREGETRHGITLNSVFADRVLVSDRSGKQHTLKLNKSRVLANLKTSTSPRTSEGLER